MEVTMSWSLWAVSSKWRPGEHHFKTLRSTSPWFSVPPFYTLTSDHFLLHPHLLLLLHIYDLVVVIVLCIPNTWTFGFHVEVVWGKGPTLCAIWASYETSTHYPSPHLQPGIWVSGIMRAVGTLPCHLQTEYQPPSDSIIAQGAGDIHKVWECPQKIWKFLSLTVDCFGSQSAWGQRDNPYKEDRCLVLPKIHMQLTNHQPTWKYSPILTLLSENSSHLGIYRKV